MRLTRCCARCKTPWGVCGHPDRGCRCHAAEPPRKDWNGKPKPVQEPYRRLSYTDRTGDDATGRADRERRNQQQRRR